MRLAQVFGAALAALCVSLAACGDRFDVINIIGPVRTDSGTTPGGCTVVITVTASTGGTTALAVGETRQLVGSFTTDPVGCATATDFDWTSSAPSVMTVSATGLVTAVAAGTADICYVLRSTPTIRSCITFTVSAPGVVRSIDYSPAGTAGAVGAPDTLTAVCTIPAGITPCMPHWWSSNTALLTVVPLAGNPMRAVLTRRAPTGATAVQIGVQWSATDSSVSRVYSHVITP